MNDIKSDSVNLAYSLIDEYFITYRKYIQKRIKDSELDYKSQQLVLQIINKPKMKKDFFLKNVDKQYKELNYDKTVVSPHNKPLVNKPLVNKREYHRVVNLIKSPTPINKIGHGDITYLNENRTFDIIDKDESYHIKLGQIYLPLDEQILNGDSVYQIKISPHDFNTLFNMSIKTDITFRQHTYLENIDDFANENLLTLEWD